jgi:hypothetical protein
MVTLWLLCKHKWWLHYVARVGREERVDTKDSGAAFHNFFEAYYDPDLRHALTPEDHIELYKQDFPEEESTEKRDQKHMLAVLKAYIDRYPIASEPFKVLDTEKKIQVDVPGCNLKLNVVIDLPIEYYNGLWALDHKTSGRLGSTYFDQFRNHWQTYTYTYALGKHFNRTCHGIYYNAIGLKKKIDADSFLRKDFALTTDQIDFHMQKWAQIVNEMHDFVNEHWRDRDRFFPSTTPTACRAYNGNCFALDYCEFNQNERLLP